MDKLSAKPEWWIHGHNMEPSSLVETMTRYLFSDNANRTYRGQRPAWHTKAVPEGPAESVKLGDWNIPPY